MSIGSNFFTKLLHLIRISNCNTEQLYNSSVINNLSAILIKTGTTGIIVLNIYVGRDYNDQMCIYTYLLNNY